jgi:hypothetical protein
VAVLPRTKPARRDRWLNLSFGRPKRSQLFGGGYRHRRAVQSLRSWKSTARDRGFPIWSTYEWTETDKLFSS